MVDKPIKREVDGFYLLVPVQCKQVQHTKSIY